MGKKGELLLKASHERICRANRSGLYDQSRGILSVGSFFFSFEPEQFPTSDNDLTRAGKEVPRLWLQGRKRKDFFFSRA